MGARKPQITTQTLRVLSAFTSPSALELSGADISKMTGLRSGTLYPILSRLEHAKWLHSRWEAEEPQTLGRPRRRLYRLTALGERETKLAYLQVSRLIGGLTWEPS